MKTIQFLADVSSGDFYSEYGYDREIAIPMMDYEAIGKNGNFQAPITYTLEKVDRNCIQWKYIHNTKKVPVEIKNLHRKFWGMKELPVPTIPQTIEELLKQRKLSFYYLSSDSDTDVVLYHANWGTPGLYHFFVKTPQGYVWTKFDNIKPDNVRKVDIRRLKSAA